MPKPFQWRYLQVFFLVFLSMVGLTGCWDRTEVNELAISMAASIDSASDHKIRYSKQIAIPSRMGGGPGSGTPTTSQGQPYMVISAVGSDMKDAMQNLQMKMSRRLFLAHRRLFLIGEPLAREGIKLHLDEMSRNPQTRLRTNVVITRGESLDYLKVGYPFEKVPTEALRKILYGDQSNFEMDIKGLMVMLSTPGAEPMVPIITLDELSPGGQKTFKAEGLAVFHGDRMVGALTMSEARGVMWLREQMRRGTVTVSVPGHKGKVSLDLLRVETHYQTQFSKGHPIMKIKFIPEVDLLENNTALDLNKAQNLELVEQAYSESVKHRIEQTLDILQHRYHSDIVKFGDRVHHAYPTEWQKLADHWDQEFANMAVTIEVNGKIRQIGTTSQSLTRKEKEVQH